MFCLENGVEIVHLQAKPRSTANSHTNACYAQLLLVRKSLKTHGRIRAVDLVRGFGRERGLGADRSGLTASGLGLAILLWRVEGLWGVGFKAFIGWKVERYMDLPLCTMKV